MLNRFRQHIARLGIHADRQTPLLLAVSGGLDSTVMAHLFHRAGISCAIVHVHYGLRGEESLEDMHFVQALARELNFSFHGSDAAAFMGSVPKAEIQQTARAWRYRVFGELCTEYGYRYMATAHHRDDQEEHFWMYRQRGNMLSALSGMPEQRPLNREQGDIMLIRPLLFLDREALRAYALAEGIRWREDRSNAEPGYLRNRLRLQQIPALKTKNPEAYTRFTEHLAEQRPVFTAFNTGLKGLDKRFVISGKDMITRLDREAILNEPLGKLWLKQYLAGFGFHADLAARIMASGNKNGLCFRGKTDWELHSHAAGWFMVKQTPQPLSAAFPSPMETAVLWCGKTISVRLITAAEARFLPRNKNTMHFDVKSLEWPLVVRSVQAGDRMSKPSGGHVKVSDLFTNMKIPAFQRPLMPLLYSGGELLGIPGLMRSGAHLMTEQSEQVLVVQYLG